MSQPETMSEELIRVSQLQVTWNYSADWTHQWIFGPPHKPIKTVTTFREAQAFAEGIALGRRLK